MSVLCFPSCSAKLPDKSEGVCGQECELDPSALPVNEEFVIYVDDDGDYIVRSALRSGLAADGATPDEAIYRMRRILDMANQAGGIQ